MEKRAKRFIAGNLYIRDIFKLFKLTKFVSENYFERITLAARPLGPDPASSQVFLGPNLRQYHCLMEKL